MNIEGLDPEELRKKIEKKTILLQQKKLNQAEREKEEKKNEETPNKDLSKGRDDTFDEGMGFTGY